MPDNNEQQKNHLTWWYALSSKERIKLCQDHFAAIGQSDRPRYSLTVQEIGIIWLKDQIKRGKVTGNFVPCEPELTAYVNSARTTTDGNAPVNYVHGEATQYDNTGLTKREHFASMALAGMSQYGDPVFIAEQSVKIADALIAELNKRHPDEPGK